MDHVDRPLPLLLVTVGTDHHPLDRLVVAVDAVLDAWGPHRVRYVCQHGSAAPSRHGRAERLLEHASLQALLREASVVVCHGGPSSVLESLRAGRRPLVVPRDPSRGEVVDDHQQRFCRFLAQRREIVLAQTPDDLAPHLHRALRDPEALRSGTTDYDAARAAAVARFREVVAAVRPGHRRRALAALLTRG